MTPSEKTSKSAETTLLVLVVDRSGSMESIREDMEGGIKTVIDEQSKEPGTCLVTLVQFDDTYEVLAQCVPVAELEHYRLIPRGSTALLDAIGRTISDVRARVEALDPDRRPGQIVFAVITDGMENASKEWSRLQVMDSVKARVDEGWHFTFLGANQDAIQEGGSVGVAAGASLTYDASAAGTREAMSSLSSSIGRIRRGESTQVEYTEQERKRSSRSIRGCSQAPVPSTPATYDGVDSKGRSATWAFCVRRHLWLQAAPAVWLSRPTPRRSAPPRRWSSKIEL